MINLGFFLRFFCELGLFSPALRPRKSNFHQNFRPGCISHINNGYIIRYTLIAHLIIASVLCQLVITNYLQYMVNKSQ